jgi:hypothetical protein
MVPHPAKLRWALRKGKEGREGLELSSSALDFKAHPKPPQASPIL